MTPQDRAKIAAVAAPTVIGLALLGYAAMQRGHFIQDTQERQHVESQIAAVLKQLESETSQPVGRQATVPDAPSEQSAYYTFMRLAAQSTGVKIVRWTSNPRVPLSMPGKPADPALASIQPLSGILEISGSYNSVISFTHQLESASRLINLSAVSWNRFDPGTDVHFSATVTRYVNLPPPAAPSAPAPINS
jgi:hypothetical protein